MKTNKLTALSKSIVFSKAKKAVLNDLQELIYKDLEIKVEIKEIIQPKAKENRAFVIAENNGKQCLISVHFLNLCKNVFAYSLNILYLAGKRYNSSILDKFFNGFLIPKRKIDQIKNTSISDFFKRQHSKMATCYGNSNF